jgi:uncharacterized membrane protein YjjB (DUF3815 family)
MIFFFRPGHVLLGAFVVAFCGLDILAHGLHDHAVGLTVAGLAFLLPSLFVGFYAARWVYRYIRAFFS